jgi:DNA-binding NarL/FixJ family response regulator
VLPGPQKRHASAFPVLTPRELDVIEMATLGLTNGQMADRLNVSIHAVKFHLAAIYRKLGVTNRTEAAVAYLRASAARETTAP